MNNNYTSFVLDDPDEMKSKKPKKEKSESALARQENLARLYESAIEAERETGRKETTPEKAKRSLIVRILSIIAGMTISSIGLVMLVTPGPGLLILAAGLGILAIDIPFARRLLMIVRDRLPQDERGKITRRTIILMVITATVGLTISITMTWYALT